MYSQQFFSSFFFNDSFLTPIWQNDGIFFFLLLNTFLVVAEGRHPCCDGKYGSVGCKTTPHHVFEEFDPENFVRTKAWPKIEKVFAIDCEMVHTTKGMEAAKVCVIDDNGNMIYESLIKPEKMVTNYNTE